MFVGLVFSGIIRDAENLLHASDESSLKRLSLISDQRRSTHPMMRLYLLDRASQYTVSV